MAVVPDTQRSISTRVASSNMSVSFFQSHIVLYLCSLSLSLCTACGGLLVLPVAISDVMIAHVQ